MQTKQFAKIEDEVENQNRKAIANMTNDELIREIWKYDDGRHYMEGYNKKNIISCCYVCNFMKRNMPRSIFIKQVKKITNYLK